MESGTSLPIMVKPPPYPNSLSVGQVTPNLKRNFKNSLIGSQKRAFFNNVHSPSITPQQQQQTNLFSLPIQSQNNRHLTPAAAAATTNFPFECQLPPNQFFFKGNSGEPGDQSPCNNNLDYSCSVTNCNNTTNHHNKDNAQHDLKNNSFPVPSAEEILMAMSLASTMSDSQEFHTQYQNQANSYDALSDIIKATPRLHQQGMNFKLNYSDSTDFLTSNTVSDPYTVSSHTPFTFTVSSINRSPSCANEVEPQTILSLDNHEILVDVHHNNKQLLEEVAGSQQQSRGIRIAFDSKKLNAAAASTTDVVSKAEKDWTYTIGQDVTGTGSGIFPTLQPNFPVSMNPAPPKCSTGSAVSVGPPSSFECVPYSGPGSDYYVEPLIGGNTTNTWSPVVSACESEIESEKDLKDELSSLEYQVSQDSWGVNIHEVEKLMSLEDLFRSWSESLPDDLLQVPVHDATTTLQDFGSAAQLDKNAASRSANVVTPDFKPFTTILSPQPQDDNVTQSPAESFTAIFDKESLVVQEKCAPTKKRKKRELKRKFDSAKVASIVGKPTLPKVASILGKPTSPKVASIIRKPTLPKIPSIVKKPTLSKVASLIIEKPTLIPKVTSIIGKPTLTKVASINGEPTLPKVASVIGKPTLPKVAPIVQETTSPKAALTTEQDAQLSTVTEEKKMWILPCKICGSKLQGGKQRYEAHMKNCHEWTCSCGNVYKSRAFLMKHVEEEEFKTLGSTSKSIVHSVTEPSTVKPMYECDLCNQVFRTTCAAKKHRKIVHSIEEIPEPKVALPKDCSYCKEKFNLRKDLKAHLKVCPVRSSVEAKPKPKKLPRLESTSSSSIGGNSSSESILRAMSETSREALLIESLLSSPTNNSLSVSENMESTN